MSNLTNTNQIRKPIILAVYNSPAWPFDPLCLVNTQHQQSSTNSRQRTQTVENRIETQIVERQHQQTQKR